jgi:hypothetical protein
MPDDFDRAQDRIEIDLAQALMAQRERANGSAQVVAAGFCLNQRCGEEFAGDDKRLFCGPNCAREFERFNR